RGREPPALVAEPAQRAAAASVAGRETARHLATAIIATLAQRQLLALGRKGRKGRRRRLHRPRAGAGVCRPRRTGGGTVRRYLQRRVRERERIGCGARAAGGGLRTAHADQGEGEPLLRQDLACDGHGRPGEGQRGRPDRGPRAAGGGRYPDRRARALVPSYAA